MAQRTINILFPAAGVVRRGGLRTAADRREPYPAVWAVNVRLEDALTNRLRGGSFTAIEAVPKEDPVYRDRAISFSGAVVKASRVGKHTDDDLSSDVSDVMRPALWVLTDAGGTPETVVAVAPFEDQHLLCFTADETWVLSGDPLTGRLRNVSREVGIIGAGAWCENHGTFYFLSSHGLYSVNADGTGLKPVSEDKIPEELTGVEDVLCTLTYNHADRGVYIHRSSGLSWFYDSGRDQFWPFDLTETDSHVLLGPFRLGQANTFGQVVNLHGNIAADSADVAWRIVTGDTAEEAAANGKAAITAALAGTSYSSYVDSSGTWSAGRAHMAYPRTRAVWCCLWLHSTGTWAFEEIILGASVSGKWR